LGLLDFFKKEQREEEIFNSAMKARDYITAVKVGEKLLQKYPDSIYIINPYTEALIKTGQKEKAVEVLLYFAERKTAEEYYDVAIVILKKILKIDPYNLKALRLLISALQKKELFFEVFKTLEESYKRFKEANLPVDSIKEMIEKFVRDQYHPLFHERYGDICKAEGKKDEAFTSYILAGNLYAKIKKYKSALRAFLKAREIKKTENLDRELINVILSGGEGEELVPTILVENSQNLDFLKSLIDDFRKAGKLSNLKKLAERIPDVKVKYFLLSLIELEDKNIESGLKCLEKLKAVDEEFYTKLLSIVTNRYPEYADTILEKTRSEESDLRDITSAIDSIISSDVSEILLSYEEGEAEEEKSLFTFDVSEDESKGIKYLSLAEAMLGLGNFEAAVENAKKALECESTFLKAAVLIANAYRLQGKFMEAINFLMEILNNRRLSEEEEAQLKEVLGEIYESMNERDRALIWYKEAYKILKVPELLERINNLRFAS
jgi:tetratricopeptide (TPR) repeat protein